MKKVIFLTLLGALFFNVSVALNFSYKISAISPELQAVMKKHTWRPACPVGFADLVLLQIPYYGFDHKTHRGKLIVNKQVANDVIDIFHALYDNKFAIAKMRLMSDYQGDDDASDIDNNTSAFNCRPSASNPKVYSLHSYGIAIDINPAINPYVTKNHVSPAIGAYYLSLPCPSAGKICHGDVVYSEFIKRGWRWGGDWHQPIDYQHFEKHI